jgi:hypothetical protein
MIKVLEIKKIRNLSDDLNRFIENNPNIKIVDIKYSLSSYVVSGNANSFSGALIIYEENGD